MTLFEQLKFYRRAKYIVLLACSVFALSASAATTLRVRALGDPQTLDWNRAHTWMDGLLIYNLMEGLVAVGPKFTPVPALAQKWSVSKDTKSYTFFLRKDAKWSDGEPLKALDFVNSWKRLLSADTKARYASILFDIENAEAFYKGQLTDFSKVGVKAIDTHTLQVKLRAPVASWIWIPTMYATFPVRQDLIEKNPTTWDRPGHTVTLGPFVLAAYEPGRTILLNKNPHYYGNTGGKRGNIDQIALALVNDDATALKLYNDGQLDFLPKLPPLERKRLKSRPDFKTWPELRTIHLRFNSAQNPMASTALRRAVAMSIDRSKIQKIFEGEYQPATSFVPPGLMAYSKSAGTTYNPERAKADLKAAGIDPLKLPPLDLLTISFDDLVILAQFIQDELKRNLGLTVKIHILEPKRYYSPLLNHSEFAMQLNLWSADFPDADNFFSIFLSNSSLNRYSWKNEKYDELVTSARTSARASARQASYSKAQKLLLEGSVATLPLYYGRISGLVRKSVHGFTPDAINWWTFKDLSLK